MECVKKHYENGKVESERYLEEGVPHRVDGPAIVYYSEDGKVDTEYWYCQGRLHREGSPAITYWEDGAVWGDSWYRHGVPLDQAEVQAIKDGQKKKRKA